MASNRYILIEDLEQMIEANPEYKADFLDRIMSSGPLWFEAVRCLCIAQSMERIQEVFESAKKAHGTFSNDRSYANSFDEYVGTACITADQRKEKSEKIFRAEAMKINSLDVAIIASHLWRVAEDFNAAGNSVQRFIERDAQKKSAIAVPAGPSI